MMKLRTWLALAAGFAATSLFGQSSADRPDIIRNPAAFGTSRSAEPHTYGANDSLQRIGLSSFAPVSSAEGYAYTNGSTSFTRYSTIAAPQPFTAHPTLPSGAVVTGVDFDVCDSNASSEVVVAVQTTDRFGQNLQSVGVGVSTSGAAGCQTLVDDLGGANIVVDNGGNQIVLEILLSSGDQTNSFAGATVHYHLQVSPPPATSDFTDVPTGHPFFQYIEALYQSGITAGCGGGNFCPDSPLTRGQMAVFLSKGLGLQFP